MICGFAYWGMSDFVEDFDYVRSIKLSLVPKNLSMSFEVQEIFSVGILVVLYGYIGALESMTKYKALLAPRKEGL